MSDWITPFKHSIARITHANGAVVGAGFLVSDRHLLSCAHVVTAALALPTHTEAPPSASVNLNFPLRQDNQRYTARVVLWQPVSPGHREEDIAVLELSTVQSGKAIALVEAKEFWEHPIRTFGFPRGHEEGVWATGTLRDERGNGWMQMDSLAYQDRPIEPGFSGAPIWDERVQGVVGMAVAAEKQRQDVSAAYLIPSSILRSVWDGFTVVSAPAPAGAIAPFKAMKLKTRQQHEALLMQRYEAAWNQLNANLSESDKVILREQVRQLEQELQQIAVEIEQIRCS